MNVQRKLSWDELAEQCAKQDRRIAELEQTFPWSEWYALNRKLADQQSENANLKALLREAYYDLVRMRGFQNEPTEGLVYRIAVAISLEPKTP